MHFPNGKNLFLYFNLQVDLLEKTVGNLSQENNNLRHENDHMRKENNLLKGIKAIADLKTALCILMGLLLCICPIMYMSNYQIPGKPVNSTHIDTLLVNMPLDGKPPPESNYNKQLIGTFKTISFNFQIYENGSGFEKKPTDVSNEHTADGNVTTEKLAHAEEATEPNKRNMVPIYQNRLKAPEEDRKGRRKLQRTINRKEKRINKGLELIPEVVTFLADTFELAGKVDNILLNLMEIRHDFEYMNDNLTLVQEAAEILNHLQIQNMIEKDDEMFFDLARALLRVSRCSKLTNEHVINKSKRDSIEALQKCDFDANSFRLINLVKEHKIINSQINSFLNRSTSIKNRILSLFRKDISISSLPEVIVSSILNNMNRHLELMLHGIHSDNKKFFFNGRKIDELQKNILSKFFKLDEYLSPALWQRVKRSPAQCVITSTKNIFEVHATIRKAFSLTYKRQIYKGA